MVLCKIDMSTDEREKCVCWKCFQKIEGSMSFEIVDRKEVVFYQLNVLLGKM